MENIREALEGLDIVCQSEIPQDTDPCSPFIGDVQSKKEECAEDESDPSALENSTILDLSGKSIESLSVVLSNQLQTLNISDNHFTALPDELQHLVNLTSLTVNQNKLVELPEWIGDLRNLVSVRLSSNNLLNLPASFSKLNLLKVLDVSNNKFSKIPDCLQVGCISLLHLNLSHNFIESWLCHPASVSMLQILSLAENSFTTWPPWLCDGKASSLVYLDLSLNPVFSHEQKQSKTSHKSAITQLNLSHCFLSQRDLNFVGQFTSLTHLQLSNYLRIGKTRLENMVREIDISALQFRTSLIQLLLRDLLLTDLPNDIHELVSLEVLDCRDNNILMLPESICKLPRLRICLLSNNALCHIPDKIGDLRSLTELRLERNTISTVPESLENLQNLCWLDLYGNLINEVPNQLGKIVENLQGLDFEFNKVSLFSDAEVSEYQKVSLFSDAEVSEYKKASLFSDAENNNDDVTWLSREKYDSLLKNMRNYPVRVSENEIPSTAEARVLGCRPPSVEQDGYSSDDSYHGKYSDFSDGLDSERGDEGRPPTGEYEEEDNWDTGHSDTDNFDPNEYDCRPKSFVAQQPVVIIPQHIIQRHRFCPSDIHVRPTKENTNGITYNPEDGQFDDAGHDPSKTYEVQQLGHLMPWLQDIFRNVQRRS